MDNGLGESRTEEARFGLRDSGLHIEEGASLLFFFFFFNATFP